MLTKGEHSVDKETRTSLSHGFSLSWLPSLSREKLFQGYTSCEDELSPTLKQLL